MGKILAAIVLCMLAGVGHATTYVYTGPFYTAPVGTFTTSMRITGQFTTATRLPANMPLTDIGPAGSNLATSWSFNDGIHTYTNANSYVYQDADFQVATDASGNITSYLISLFVPLPPITAGEVVSAIFTQSGGPYQAFDEGPCGEATADNKCGGIDPTGAKGYVLDSLPVAQFQTGVPATPVPTLGVVPLLALGATLALLALGGVKRRVASSH